MKRNLEAELEAARKEVKQLQELLALKEKVAALSEKLGLDRLPSIPQMPYIPVPYPVPQPYPVYPQPYPIYPRPWYPATPHIVWGKTEIISTGTTTNTITLDNDCEVGTSVYCASDAGVYQYS